ncbi:bifunctional DNA-formamidopyrimidine glycosylase/DNA-(apurinic or apyrimidinic site) lyase [Tomitella fengzijianii]|uniref:Formamidopyrimidine-DNA glycosylase n=1 Tax=Tomitella fengzijianii TaxID=2597660 RepID=A0A516X3S9_9ACTN|nr:bifunctional DNA-formamidopyrimidine glycosylase/DNA-(apurinic or apyrimidinic site) lyase [Tomitella fengzijianii]QDQ97717.1 bifunctional DNA-formamidopyrimidine glycosylase/DNA-(apurinic or apyrimidinic site) lyase [Tomitella fengzijianii]
MPELPEVEVVRAGLAPHVRGRRIVSAAVHSERTARRFEPGAQAMAAWLAGGVVADVGRRGKYLWFELAGAPPPVPGAAADDYGRSALVVHLGMSGQMLVRDTAGGPVPDVPVSVGTASEGAVAEHAMPHRHLRAGLVLGCAPGETDDVRVEFVDQRTFGWWLPAPFVDVDGTSVPAPVAHIARDPMDPRFDVAGVVRVLKSKRSEIKRLLLDQTVVSGIGNIYADEALWRARVHGARPANTLSRPALTRVVEAARDVMADALAQGGTSFDALYVNVNGQSGYFSRSLNAYGRAGEPCKRCGTLIERAQFMNRSSYFCPKCQRRPRTAK